MDALSDLITRRDDLNRQIAERQAVARNESLVKAREALAALGLKPEDLIATRVRPAKRGTVAAKYDNLAGKTWTGRGKQPVWVREALAAGHPLDKFLIR